MEFVLRAIGKHRHEDRRRADEKTADNKQRPAAPKAANASRVLIRRWVRRLGSGIGGAV